MTNVLVVDASVLAPALADDGADGDAARLWLQDGPLFAPELVDLEVTSVLRRALRSRALDARRAALAMDDLIALPLYRAPHRPLLARCLELRDSLTVYDAAYVALAERLGAPLVTADARLAAATGVRCDVKVVSR